MNKSKLIILLLAVVAIVGAGVYAYPKIFRPESSTERSEEQKNIKRRDAREAFVMPSEEELREMLTPLQYYVTQEEGTERPKENEYWDNYEDGIYVDIVSGEPLFSSQHKYKSGTGWPSFYQPIEGVELVEKIDNKLFA